MRLRTPSRALATLALGAACASALAQPLELVFTEVGMATRIDAASIRNDGPYRVGRATYALTVPRQMGAHPIDGGEDVYVVDCAARTFGFAQRRFMVVGTVVDERTIPRNDWARTLQPVPAVASAPRAIADRLCDTRESPRP
jgi:hypothetical protein